MPAEQLNKLKQTRQGYRTSTKKLIAKITEYYDKRDTEQTPQTELTLISNKLMHYNTSLDKLNNEISPLVAEEDFEAESDACLELQDAIWQAQSHLAILLSHQPDLGSHNSGASDPDTQYDRNSTQVLQHNKQVRLPKLELAKFDGNPLGWQEYWDGFDSTIHQSDLPTIDKFKYLKSSLKGDAARMVDGFRLIEANYDTVIEALHERYGNKDVAIFVHFEQLLALSTISTETPSLQSTYNQCERHIRSIVALGLSEDTFGLVFSPIILSKLPRLIRVELHRQNGSQSWDINTLRDLFKGELKARQMGEWSISDNNRDSKHNKVQTSPKQHTSNRYKPLPTTSTLLQQSKSGQSKGNRSGTKHQGRPVSCVFCGEDHYSDQCTNVPDYHARKDIVKKGRHCFKCLSTKHQIRDCPKSAKCFYCGEQSHHSSLCAKKGQAVNNRVTTDSFVAQAVNQSSVLDPQAAAFQPKPVSNNAAAADGSAVHLQMAMVSFHGQSLQIQARVFLDPGSSCSYIISNLAKRLKLKPHGSMQVSNAHFEHPNRTVKSYQCVTMSIPVVDGSPIDIDAFVNNAICAPLQKLPLSVHRHPILRQIRLADAPANASEYVPIDIVIGQDFYYDFVNSEQIRFDQGLILIGSKFGYITAGRILSAGCGSALQNESTLMVATMLNCSNRGPRVHNPAIERFWNLEAIGVVDDSYQKDDDLAVQHFNNAVKKVKDRYEVGLPWKEDKPDLPDNHGMAMNRLRLLTKRLNKQPALLNNYNEIIQGQVKMGVIEEVQAGQTNKHTGLVHYFPHHAVLKPSSATTKVRVVHNASAKTGKYTLSLNDCLFRGPVFLSDLCGLLLRFRTNRIAFACDIEKAFFQVALWKTDRDVTRFLWLKDPTQPATPENMVTYRFTKVPFGIISSPFLLSATIKHHLQQDQSDVANNIAANIYVDNIISGAESVAMTQWFYSETLRLFGQISMNVREWYTNSLKFLQTIPEEHRGSGTIAKVLGMLWNVNDDTISFADPKFERIKVRTKRHLVQAVSKVFDPCGFLTPALVKAKLLIQDTWRKQLKWDDALPEQTLLAWDSLQTELTDLTQVTIPRFNGDNGHQTWDIHCFCDASGKAYAAVVYLRSISGATHLVFAKCKLAPMKDISIPRLELMAIIVGTRLVRFVKKQLALTFQRTVVWSDSKYVLHWLASTKVLSTFASNRIREIRTLDCDFRYVPTAMNPADLPTRGLSAKQLADTDLWWQGPPFIRMPESNWPTTDIRFDSLTDDPPEVLIDTMVNQTAVESFKGPFGINPNRFSTLRRLMHVTSYVNRFLRKLKASIGKGSLPVPDTSQSTCLTAQELAYAKTQWTRYVQQEFVNSTSFRNLKSQFDLFQDSEEIWRCNGRLHHAEISETAKFPALLPKSHPFTGLIINDCHQRVHHSGVLHTLAELRSAFWVANGRTEVQRVIKRCPTCRIWEGGPYRSPPFLPLPALRVNRSVPFEYTGVDYLGPLLISDDRASPKVWICLFTCAVTRALHLEVVGDLTTEQFLLCLRRFISGYGRPKMIISDNGKYFKLASDVLKHLWNEICRCSDVHEFLAGQEIRWKFITEYAPWMGGFYERLVGSAKRALKKVLGRQSVTLVQLQTLVAEIGAILNSRPLVLSTDVKDQMLSPADLLGKQVRSGLPATVLPETLDMTFVESPCLGTNLVQTWKENEQILQQFWDIWRSHYLTALHERRSELSGTRGAASETVAVGIPVLIRNNTVPRSVWKVGTINELVNSADGVVRSAVIKLPSGRTVTRPVKLLYLLEVAQLQDKCIAQHTQAQTQSNIQDNHAQGSAVEDDICPPTT